MQTILWLFATNLIIQKGDFKKKMQPKCDIGGQISKVLYHYIFYIIQTREHQNFRNKYWLKNKIKDNALIFML